MGVRLDEKCAECGHARSIHNRVGQWATACLASKTDCVVETMCPCNKFEEGAMAGQSDELQEMAEATQVLARTVVEEVRGAVPSPSQWARAQALREARAWCAELNKVRANVSATDIEAYALRWATFIETGELRP